MAHHAPSAAEIAALVDEIERLRGHILDIDGYIGTYLLTAGALHRALGKIGHSAPSCQAEAERKMLLEGLIAANARADAYAVAGGTALKAAERLQDLAEKARAWRDMRRGAPTKPKPESAALIAAVDALVDEAASEIDARRLGEG